MLRAPGPASAVTLIAANERNPRLALMSPLLAKGFIKERVISTDFLIPLNFYCAKHSAVVALLVGVACKNTIINDTSLKINYTIFVRDNGTMIQEFVGKVMFFHFNLM